MRKMVAVVALVLLASTAYAGVGFSFGFGYQSHPYHYRYYPRSYGYHYYPYYYWWYPSYPALYYYNPMVDVRCQVKPESASVLVDGYYAGRVDDFDGFFQRLRIAPGKHTITFRNPGYAPLSVSVYGVRGQDIHIKQNLMAGDDRLPEDSRLQSQRGDNRGHVVPPYGSSGRSGGGYSGGDEEEQQEGRGYSPQPSAPPSTSTAPRIDGQGLVRLKIEPAGASVYIDGNFWGVVQESGAVEVQLVAGSHTIEIVKPGFQTFRKDVRVTEGGDTEIEAELVAERGGRNL